MTHSARWLSLSVLILLLLSPLAGVPPFHSVQQDPLSGASADGGRGSGDDYSVELDIGDRQEGDEALTRNQTHSYEFVVRNTGTQDDTYTLTVSWEDPDGHGWDGTFSSDTLAVPAGQEREFDLVVTSPRGGVVKDDSTTFNLTATSTESATTSDDEAQLVRIITPYAVDVYDLHPAAQSANRGEKATFSGEIKNVGENTDSYSLRFDYLPRDWVAAPLATIDTVVAGETREYRC